MAQIVRTSEAAAIGLHGALLVAASPGERLSTSRVAAHLDISTHHCSKVLQRLPPADMLEAVRGPYGGFSLAKPAGEIELLEVYEAIDGPLQDTQCLFHRPHCRFGECVLGDMFAEVNRVIRSHLDGLTLADVLASRPERFDTGHPEENKNA
jgi:Rrf2 family protein